MEINIDKFRKKLLVNFIRKKIFNNDLLKPCSFFVLSQNRTNLLAYS